MYDTGHGSGSAIGRRVGLRAALMRLFKNRRNVVQIGIRRPGCAGPCLYQWGCQKPGDRCEDMNEKREEKARLSIVVRSANAGNYGEDR